MKIVALFVLFFLSGCGSIPRISIGKNNVTGVKDQGKPATLDEGTKVTAFAVPANTVFTVEKQEATPTKPATEIQSWKFSAPTRFEETASLIKAQTGTVDTSIAMKRIDVEERRWLLWAAIGCGIAGVVLMSLMPSWPGLSRGLLISAAIAGVAWKVSAIPPWLFGVGAAVMAVMAIGYKKAESDKSTELASGDLPNGSKIPLASDKGPSA